MIFNPFYPLRASSSIWAGADFPAALSAMQNCAPSMLLLGILHRGTCYLLVVFLWLLFGIWYLIIVYCLYLLFVCCCCVFWFGALGITLGGQIASCSAHQSTNTLLQMLGESGDLQDWNLWTKKAWTQNILTLRGLKICGNISSSLPCPPIRSSTPWPPNQPYS